MNVIEAKSAMRDLGTKAQAVVDDASLSGAEKMTRLEEYHVDLKAAQDVVAVHESAQRLMVGGEAADDAKSGAGERTVNKAFAQQVIESDSYKSMKNGSARFGQVEVKVAATIDEGIIPAYSGGAGLAGQLLTPQFLPGIVPLKFQPLTVADLLASGTTSSSSVSYVIEAAFQDLTAT